jgi:DNA-binding PadR family transcriptional regulator
MEKTLLLLGLLRSHEMHGYQLGEVLAQNEGIAINLKKSNAYKLLGKMESDGWITHREEREGNRPRRRVYTVTPEGEAAFQRLLRGSLAGYVAPEFPSAVAFNFLQELSPDEAATLLGQRRRLIEAHFQRLDEFADDVRQSHPGIEFLHRHYSAELSWLDEIIGSLQTA